MLDYSPYFAQASMSGNGIFGLMELVVFVGVVIAVLLGLGLFKGNKGWRITWFGCALFIPLLILALAALWLIISIVMGRISVLG